MEIEDSFRVDLPVDETWRVLLDIERIAPCLPGAQLQEIAGDEYRGVVKVKVGPITASSSCAIRTRWPPHSGTGVVACSSTENHMLAIVLASPRPGTPS